MSADIEAVLRAHRDRLLRVPGVVGVAQGLCDAVPCIRIFLASAEHARESSWPEALDGIAVRVEVTGPAVSRGK